MARGRDGTSGERLPTCTAPPAMAIDFHEAKARFIRAHNGKAIVDGAWLLMVVAVGLDWLKRCASCSTGLPCQMHSLEAYGLTSTGRASSDGNDPHNENEKLQELWIALWKRTFGEAHRLSRTQCIAIANARRQHDGGFRLLSEAFAGAFADEAWARRNPPSLTAVLADPSRFAARAKATAQKNGAQQGGDAVSWEPGA